MKPILNFIDLQGVSIEQQVRWEEALFRVGEGNWCLWNQGSTPTIVMGISGNLEESICHEHWLECSYPVLRRFTGGGTVIVDKGTQFISLIGDIALFNQPLYPEILLKWSTDFYQTFPFDQEEILWENDYVYRQRKWGGNALAISNKRWILHSSLLWDYSQSKMDCLALPARRPIYRKNRAHIDFLCCLKDFFKHEWEVKLEIMGQLKERFVFQERGIQDLREIEKKTHRKVTAWVRNG